MNRIRLLADQVANQIAAGEVIERPASVVKELVENALDAAARHITIEIQAGGRSLIRVADDGAGMSRDDALLCLERHATSKLRVAEDLRSIRTMGFRGEALPSIASVSRMSITTLERDGGLPEGTEILLHGGKILEVKAAGRTPGTTVEVRSLFFNLPARRKFLRTEETERAHIQHYVTLAAAAHPEVGFTFIQGSRAPWQLPPARHGAGDANPLEGLRERLESLPGGERRVIPIDFAGSLDPLPAAVEEGEEAGAPGSLRVWGFIGEPGVSRGSREEQHLFVNRRPVENRGLNFALLEGYHTALMKGRYPVCCLFLEIDPDAVDVNIHPAKREVKFHQESAVRRLMAEAVRGGLLRFHAGRPAADSPPPPSMAPFQNTNLTRSNLAFPSTAASAASVVPPYRETLAGATVGDVPPPLPKEETSPRQPAAVTPAASGETLRPPIQTTFPERPSAPPSPAQNDRPLLNVPLRILGVIGKLYVALESDRGLVLLDQHAAHERILFEQMLRRLEQGSVPSQRLLLPETLELSPRDAQFVREQIPTLNRLGVGLSEFGERTFLLDALPPFAKAPNAKRFAIELVEALKETGQTVNTWRLGEQMIAKTVCRHAVKANDPLRGPELENLVEDLRRCEMPYTCPHGRPTLIEMNFRELDRKFGRAQ